MKWDGEGIEMLSNPMHKGGKRGGAGKGGGGEKRGGGGVEMGVPQVAADVALSVPPPPVPATAIWTKLVDTSTGSPYFSDENDNTTWIEPFAKEWSEERGEWTWRSLVDGRVVRDDPNQG